MDHKQKSIPGSSVQNAHKSNFDGTFTFNLPRSIQSPDKLLADQSHLAAVNTPTQHPIDEAFTFTLPRPTAKHQARGGEMTSGVNPNIAEPVSEPVQQIDSIQNDESAQQKPASWNHRTFDRRFEFSQPIKLTPVTYWSPPSSCGRSIVSEVESESTMPARRARWAVLCAEAELERRVLEEQELEFAMRLRRGDGEVRRG